MTWPSPVLLAGLLLVACHDDPAATPQAPEPAPPEAFRAAPATGVAALAGEWEGAALVPQLGSVAAVITLGADGEGTAVATAAGVVESRSFVVTRFGGGILELRTTDGVELRVEATLTGDRLELTPPGGPRLALRRVPAR